jgi:ketosteroid isomerase-like protein
MMRPLWSWFPSTGFVCRRQRGPVWQTSLLQDVVDVVLDGGHGNEQAAGDLLVTQAVGNQRGNLALAPGKQTDTVIRANFCRTQNNHRLPKSPRRGKIDGQATVEVDILGQRDEFLQRYGASVVSMHRLDELAETKERVLTDGRRIAVEHIYPHTSLTERAPSMPVKAEDKKIVEELLRAMQTGPSAFEELLALFSEDAVLVEPFAGSMQTHTGKQAIRGSLNEMSQNRAADLTLKLDRVDMDGSAVRAEWTCTSTSMPGPMRGYDMVTIRGGKISRLEIFITEMPAMG